MRYLASGLFFGLALACSAAEIGLETLPWTDAARHWTPGGSRLPRINGNPSGTGRMAVGGVEFERGIGGHSGFSVVYRLDRTADSFSARVGIDDERLPGDKDESADLWAVVLVDGREAFRRRVVLGDNPVEVEIDLRGKHQLELRGEYGERGFRRQRMAWGNPVIRTGDPEKLRAALERNRKAHEQNAAYSPAYPEAPDWRQVAVRRIAWNGFRNAYKIGNSRFEMVVVPEFGGRVLEFRKRDGASLLKPSFVSGANAMVRGAAPDGGGGHFMRVQPPMKFFPNDPILKHGRFRVEFPAEGEIVLTSAESLLFGVVYEYRLRLEENGLRLVNRIRSTAPYERRLGVWSITRLERSGVREVWAAPERVAPLAPFAFSRKGEGVALERRSGAFVLNTVPPPGAMGGTADFRCWSAPPEVRSLGGGGDVLAVRYPEPEGGLDGEYPVHLYFNDRFIEVESHGPTVTAGPGEAVSLEEYWTAP